MFAIECNIAVFPSSVPNMKIPELSFSDQIKLKELSAPSVLTWDDTEDNTVSRKMTLILSLKNQSCPFTPSCPAMFTLHCDATREKLITMGVSPSGTFQAALQLALLKMCNRPMGVFEIISIRYVVL